jgi:NAD+-dependent protein deacetylase SIR2
MPSELEVLVNSSQGNTPSSTPPSCEEGGNKRRKPKPRLPKRDKLAVEMADFSRFSQAIPPNLKDLANDKEIFQEIVLLHHILQHSRRLVVVTGAGISVAAGIPDFRSQTGLFTTLRSELRLKGSGKSMFDSSVYRDDTATSNFHTTVRDLHKLCKQSSPTAFHSYLSEIAEEGRLCRLYSQNIDCLDTQLPRLETKVPLTHPWPTTVQLHGTILTMVCTKCGWSGDLVPEMFQTEDVPECPECIELEKVRVVAGKRTQGVGRLRPRIVLYNEANPDADAIGEISHGDLSSKPDGLVVVGTSLKIPGVRRLVREMANAVHAAKGAVVWMNVDNPPSFGAQFDGCFDLIVKGDCQVIPQLMKDYEHYLHEKGVEKERKRVERLDKRVKLEAAKAAAKENQSRIEAPIVKGTEQNNNKSIFITESIQSADLGKATRDRDDPEIDRSCGTGNFVFVNESKRVKIETEGQ